MHCYRPLDNDLRLEAVDESAGLATVTVIGSESDMAVRARIDYHGPTARRAHFRRFEKAIVTLSALAFKR